MTNNIEKLYKLANIEATAIGCTNDDIYNPVYCEGDCIDCTWYDEDEVFPPFTAVKQLELIKWLSIQRNGFLILNPTDNKKEFLVGTNYYWGRCDTQTKKLQDFPQALAGLVCELWEDLTEQQRKEVRGILQ